jgi:hypothetical protein
MGTESTDDCERECWPRARREHSPRPWAVTIGVTSFQPQTLSPTSVVTAKLLCFCVRLEVEATRLGPHRPKWAI